MTDRRKIPYEIYEVLQQELVSEGKSEASEHQTQSSTHHTLTVE